MMCSVMRPPNIAQLVYFIKGLIMTTEDAKGYDECPLFKAFAFLSYVNTLVSISVAGIFSSHFMHVSHAENQRRIFINLQSNSPLMPIQARPYK
jgi:hypothetical protein